MTQKISKILALLKKHYPGAKTALHHKTPHQMLVSTILSAQCTDERVNKVTPELFARYKTPKDFAQAKLPELEKMVKSTGFYKNKAKNIKASAQMIVEKFGGKVPKKMDDLVALPGVARKTANVVLQSSFGINVGVVVDTHVGRLSRRLGLTKETNPEKVEKDLMKVVPKKEWDHFAFWLIDHGRAVCKSAKPDCDGCFLNKLCPSAFKFDKKGKWVGPK